MLRKTLVIIAAATIGVFWLSSCKKRSEEAKPGEPDTEVRKTMPDMADYLAEAEKEIGRENLAEELEKLEKEIEEDIRSGEL